MLGTSLDKPEKYRYNKKSENPFGHGANSSVGREHLTLNQGVLVGVPVWPTEYDSEEILTVLFNQGRNRPRHGPKGAHEIMKKWLRRVGALLVLTLDVDAVDPACGRPRRACGGAAPPPQRWRPQPRPYPRKTMRSPTCSTSSSPSRSLAWWGSGIIMVRRSRKVIAYKDTTLGAPLSERLFLLTAFCHNNPAK